MKQYCKRVNIRSVHYIKHCIYACLDGKWSRSDVHDMLACFCDWDVEDIAKCAKDIGERKKLEPVIEALALHIQKSIKTHNIELPRARNKTIQDGITRKIRNITIASMLQQIYDYIAKIGLQELFDAKFTPHQCATIPGRGQIYGKKFNERWLREKKVTYKGAKVTGSKPAYKYAIEADVRKCYPSMSIGKLKAHLKRDVRNPELLWLVFFLIDKMTREQRNLRSERLKGRTLRFVDGKGLRGSRVKRGISIGSYLSCNLCNYMLSYAWRYLMQDCCRWETRRGKRVRVRLVKRCIVYMDNFTLYGDNKRDLSRAEQLLERYVRKELGMHIKRNWRKYRLAYEGRDGKLHGCPVDGMGYVVYPDHTEMRGKIFLRARRSFARLKKARLKKKQPSKKLCGSVVAYNGFFENTDSRRWRRHNDYKYHVFCAARKTMGKYMREEVLHARQSEIERYAAAG